MNRIMLKELNNDFEQAYKELMSPLYLKWKDEWKNNELNEMFMLWIFKHRHEKIMKLLNARKHRKNKMKEIKDKLALLEYDRVEENLLEEITK